jgi:hypothetical protein
MLLQTKNIEEFISRYQVDAVIWKADRLLSNIDNPVIRNDRTKEVATMLAAIPDTMGVMRDDYIKQICERHAIIRKTMEKMIAEVNITERKKTSQAEKKHAKKNKALDLKQDPKTFKFFSEIVKKDKDGAPIGLEKIKIDKEKFIQLLSSFGFSRYEPRKVDGVASDKDEFTFIQLKENVITSVTRNQIIDHVERFIRKEYDFEKAKYEFTEAQPLISAMYDQIKSIFSKDLFARMRTEEPIIINTDKKDSTYLYYKNGFVEVGKTGLKLRSYSEMSGSVWEHQMLDRDFKEIDIKGKGVEDMGIFARFCFLIANSDAERFKALCCIIGYLMHDFYEYKLKAILFTDSTLSQASEGRTGKTLISKMLGNVRSYCEINGKDFKSDEITKYQMATLGTQILHLNDVKNTGKNKFYFEDVFNDVTEGYIVKKLYMPVFRQYSKMIISTNRTLDIEGGSQRDRIIEFEVSDYFSESHTPEQEFGAGGWFPERDAKRRDWDEQEFNRFDNFMCYCAQLFHQHGLIEASTINLNERKLMNHTSKEFIDFMDEIEVSLQRSGLPWSGYAGSMQYNDSQVNASEMGHQYKITNMNEFGFDKKLLFDKFMSEYKADFDWLKPRKFHVWLMKYSEQRMGVKIPKEWKSNSASYIQFIPEPKK